MSAHSAENVPSHDWPHVLHHDPEAIWAYELPCVIPPGRNES